MQHGIANQTGKPDQATATAIVCEAWKNGCDHMIHTSTSEVYGTAQYIPIDEKHPLQPQSSYWQSSEVETGIEVCDNGGVICRL